MLPGKFDFNPIVSSLESKPSSVRHLWIEDEMPLKQRYVIPTFDLGYFLSTEARSALQLQLSRAVFATCFYIRRTAFSERQSEVWKGFQKFVHQAGAPELVQRQATVGR